MATGGVDPRVFPLAGFVIDEAPWVRPVLEFWFQELDPALWFATDAALDERIRIEFGDLLASVANEKPESISGARALLAAIIVTDQFPRNMFRGSARAFVTDPLARALSERLIAQRLDAQLAPVQRYFAYLPFEHSENLEHQALAVRLIEALGDKTWASHAHWHRGMIERFGRFPHRNQALGRTSTDDERAYLARRNQR